MSDSNNNVRDLFRVLFKRIVNEMVESTIRAFKEQDVSEVQDWETYFRRLGEDSAEPFEPCFLSDWPAADCIRLLRLFESSEVMSELQTIWMHPSTDRNVDFSTGAMWMLRNTLEVAIELELRERSILPRKVDAYLLWRASVTGDKDCREEVWNECVVGDKKLPKETPNARVA